LSDLPQLIHEALATIIETRIEETAVETRGARTCVCIRASKLIRSPVTLPSANQSEVQPILEVSVREETRNRVAVGKLCGLLPLLALLLSAARADEPSLVLHLTSEESAVYAVGGITRIGFDGDETLLVVTDGGVDGYATGTIRRIEFLWDVSGAGDPGDAAGMIDALHLFQSQPNPFSSETRIGFQLPKAGEVELAVYGPDGRLVRTLVDGERPAGRQAVPWDGLDDAGRSVSGGVYFYTLRAPGLEESRRMILLP
jgi:hypothetical protein